MTLATVCLLLVARGASSDSGPRLVGARATALAGAFTAVADDSTAFYWNPAGIVHGSLIRGGFYGGTSFQDRNELVERLRSELPGADSVLEGGPSLGFSTSFTAFGVAVSSFTETDTFLEETTLRSRGLETLDVTMTLVQSLPVDVLTVGVNVSVIRGTAFEQQAPAASVPPADRNVRNLFEAATSSDGRAETEIGLDASVLYQPRDWIRVGLMGRNLTRPTFHTPSDEEIVRDRHARAGVVFMKDPGWLVAIDFDLTSRDASDLTKTMPSWRELALGAEKQWGDRRVALRGGFRSELADGALRRPGFSVGVGVRIAMLIVDVGGITSTERRQGGVWLGLSLTR
ncbi:MAG TPA: conjugal transfer protein TraF [Vicinamibacteria bacterium]|jgi:hypothetical protein